MTKKKANKTFNELVWDEQVMEIEELFAAYEPETRARLKDHLINAIDRGEGSDEQKQQANDILDAAFSNVAKNKEVVNIKWLDDQVEIARRLTKMAGIGIDYDDLSEQRRAA
jgi:hypothetical protein